jgi:hypothetical protein
VRRNRLPLSHSALSAAMSGYRLLRTAGAPSSTQTMNSASTARSVLSASSSSGLMQARGYRPPRALFLTYGYDRQPTSLVQKSFSVHVFPAPVLLSAAST